MKCFFWFIGSCMIMFCKIYSMESRHPLPKTHSLRYIVAEVDKNADKDIQREQQKEREKIGWEIILKHGNVLFDYMMIRSLVLNNDFDEMLRKTTENRELYLQKYACRSGCDYYMECNKSLLYGAINGKVLIESINDLLNIITIERNYLLSPMSSPARYRVNNFHGVLPHQPQPFFNSDGDFCFYGYGEKSNLINVKSGTVVLYSLSVTGMQKIIECVAAIKKHICRLRIFLEFPHLLQAFLNSCKVYEQMVDDEYVKVFDLEGVTIPRGYGYCQRYFSDSIQYRSFYELSELIRENIVAQYKKQCAKKKLKALYEKLV